MTTTIPFSRTPRGLQVVNWILDPTGYQCRNHRRHGDLFRAEVSFQPLQSQMGAPPARVLMVSDPQALQSILTQDTGKVFSAPGELNKIVESVVGSRSSLLLSGEAHRRRRQLVIPAFHGERLKVFGQVILQITEDVMGSQSLQQPFSARPLMQRLTMRIILEAVFGLHQNDRYGQLEHLLAQRLEMTANPLTSVVLFLPFLQKDLGAWSPGGRIKALDREVDRLIFQEIHDRRQQDYAERSDILSVLLGAVDEQGHPLTDQELRDELVTLLVAGHETTATSLTWGLYWLHRHPEVQDKMRSELAELPTPWDPMAILRLPYLEAVCNEVLRVHPVAMLTFPRQVEQATTLMGYALEPGDILLGSIYLLHHREDLYPNPWAFRPERFLERSFSPYEFMPFGAGVRRCVGAALALYELKLALAAIVCRWEFVLDTQRPLTMQRRGVTLSPNGKVMLRRVGDRPGQGRCNTGNTTP